MCVCVWGGGGGAVWLMKKTPPPKKKTKKNTHTQTHTCALLFRCFFHFIFHINGMIINLSLNKVTELIESGRGHKSHPTKPGSSSSARQTKSHRSSRLLLDTRADLTWAHLVPLENANYPLVLVVVFFFV